MAEQIFPPSARSIYFSSLLNSKNADLNELGVQGALYLNENNFIEHSPQRLFEALKILEKGIAIEQGSEKEYFSNLLRNVSTTKMNEKTQNVLQQRLNSIFSGESFDYTAFIKFINDLLLGEKQTNEIIKYERQRLNGLEQLNQHIRQQEKIIATKKEDDKVVKRTIKGQNRINRYMDNEYLTSHTFPTLKEYFTSIKGTIDGLLSVEANKIIERVLASDAVEKLQQAFTNDDYQDVAKISILNQIVKETTADSIITQVIQKALNQTNNLDGIINQIVNDLVTKTEEKVSRSVHENQTLKQYQKKEIKQIKQEGDQILVSGRGLGGLALGNSTVMEKIKGMIPENDKNTEEKLNNLIKDYYDALSPAKENEKEKQKKISSSAALGNLSKFLKNIIQSYIESQLKKMYDPKQLMQDLEKQLIHTTIEITGPQYSELISRVVSDSFQNLIAYDEAKRNKKADSIYLNIAPVTITTDVPEPSQKILQDALSKVNKELISNLYESTYAEQATDYERTKKGYLSGIEKRGKLMEQIIKKNITNAEEQAKALEAMSAYLKSTIVVTETVKTFRLYQNDIGFVAGSLGGNLGAQLNNFQELFTSAGFPMSAQEMEWLEVAIVNCSPHAIGAKNKGPIERYLSTMAGFAVFDEASAEISMIAETVQQQYIESSPQIIHIYRLNGLYFPGSYILTKIYNSLNESFLTAEEELGTIDGAKIVSTASPNIINQNIHNTADRWADTYEKAKSMTSIEVTFLSRLLDILNNLAGAFNL